MSFLWAARAALANQKCFRWMVAAVAVVLAGLSVSCGGSSSSSSASHNAYVTQPQIGSVLLLHINNSTGAITTGARTPPVPGASSTGIALHTSKKFVFVANSGLNNVSVFNVAGDGSLTHSSDTAAGSGPIGAVVDPAGQFLLVTNNLSDNISVFQIDSGSGALTEVSGSPFFANHGPADILVTPSGKFVYTMNPAIGMITAFSFTGGVLTQVTGSPFFSGAGASALTVDPGEKFLYAANTSDNTVSGFQIDATSGFLKPVQGSPFSTVAGAGPSAIAIDTTGKFVYVATQGSSFSIWAYTFDATTGTLTPVQKSPFNLLAAGGLFLLMEPSGGFFYIGNQSGSNIAGYKYDTGTAVPTAISGSPFATASAPGRMVIVH